MFNGLRDLRRKNLGQTGEKIAADFLNKNGIRVIGKNFRSRFGEIDLIGLDKDAVCFVEVKTRKDPRFGDGLEAVSKLKQSKMIKTALIYLKTKGWENKDFRFDVISIMLDNQNPAQVTHIQNAFEGF